MEEIYSGKRLPTNEDVIVPSKEHIFEVYFW